MIFTQRPYNSQCINVMYVHIHFLKHSKTNHGRCKQLAGYLWLSGDLNMTKLLLSTQTFDFILNSILKTPNIVRLI